MLAVDIRDVSTHFRVNLAADTYQRVVLPRGFHFAGAAGGHQTNVKPGIVSNVIGVNVVIHVVGVLEYHRFPWGVNGDCRGEGFIDLIDFYSLTALG